ncbi:hypothetical protein BHE74_00042325 [Ensete ventricosum]|nr:hypothetical protein GW17_00020488 [Ensete ventricosum]RWW51340.1 hypothetical protein BHE74_00042325 [Ensete ventricosum]
MLVTEECLERAISVCKDGASFKKIGKKIRTAHRETRREKEPPAGDSSPAGDGSRGNGKEQIACERGILLTLLLLLLSTTDFGGTAR